MNFFAGSNMNCDYSDNHQCIACYCMIFAWVELFMD